MVQMAEAGPERNSTCPRSHSKKPIELNANGTHLGSECMCVGEDLVLQGGKKWPCFALGLALHLE